MLRRHKDRALHVAIALSVLLHVAALFKLPQVRVPESELTQHGLPGELVVQLAPQARPPPSRPSVRAPQAPAAPASPPPPKPAPVAKPAAKPPVLALRERAPSTVPPTPQAAPAPQPPATDFSAYVEARQRARGQSPAAESAPGVSGAEEANARANRLAAANLAAGRDLTFGYDPRRSGGVFTIKRLTSDEADFMFFGWNREIRRKTAQLVTVQKGNNRSIELAVVRKMIAIIREYEQEDFVWESERLGRNVTLSARQRDNSGLEDFMMREFFEDFRRGR